jgi:hypothetical protein
MTEVRLITLSGDLSQVIEDLILNSIRKIVVVFIRADILEWQNRNAFGRNFSDRTVRFFA